jgi:hypothetical protein
VTFEVCRATDNSEMSLDYSTPNYRNLQKVIKTRFYSIFNMALYNCGRDFFSSLKQLGGIFDVTKKDVKKRVVLNFLIKSS